MQTDVLTDCLSKAEKRWKRLACRAAARVMVRQNNIIKTRKVASGADRRCRAAADRQLNITSLPALGRPPLRQRRASGHDDFTGSAPSLPG